jgi:excisionase family DNA binding protein
MGVQKNHGTRFDPVEEHLRSNLGAAVPLRPPGFAEKIALAKTDPGAGRREPAPFLNSAQVANWLGISQRTVCLWAELDEIPGFKLGHQWRFREDDIRGWLQSRLASLKRSEGQL